MTPDAKPYPALVLSIQPIRAVSLVVYTNYRIWLEECGREIRVTVFTAVPEPIDWCIYRWAVETSALDRSLLPAIFCFHPWTVFLSMAPIGLSLSLPLPNREHLVTFPGT